MAYNDKQIRFIRTMRLQNKEWAEIAKSYNQEFGENKTIEAMRKTYKRYEEAELDEEDVVVVKSLEKARRVGAENQKLKKEQNILIDSNLVFQDVLEAIDMVVGKVKVATIKPPKLPAKKTGKKKMIIEPVLSDLHYGLKTSTFDTAVARRRVSDFTTVLLEEYDRYKKLYEIEKFNLLNLGDVIQSATMHKDSQASSELTNAQQIAVAIESLYFDFLLPVAMTGEKVDFIGISGNHDRENPVRFTVSPGKYYYSYSIYYALQVLAKAAKLDNVNFIIPEEHFHVYEIFGSHFLAEHGDNIGKNAPENMEKALSRRSVQTNRLLKGIRIGHFHSDFCGSQGRYICNGSITTGDHYAEMLGFKSRACQLINYYVETKERETPFYHSFCVNLE